MAGWNAGSSPCGNTWRAEGDQQRQAVASNSTRRPPYHVGTHTTCKRARVVAFAGHVPLQLVAVHAVEHACSCTFREQHASHPGQPSPHAGAPTRRRRPRTYRDAVQVIHVVGQRNWRPLREPQRQQIPCRWLWGQARDHVVGQATRQRRRLGPRRHLFRCHSCRVSGDRGRVTGSVQLCLELHEL